MLRKLLGLRESGKGVVPPQVAADARIYAIGDIHGRHDLIVSLMDLLISDSQNAEDERRAQFVFLGDYIDRGNKSAQVLDMLCDLEVAAGDSCTFLRGNHEAALLAFLDDPVEGVNWLEWGGLQTLESYGIQTPSADPAQTELYAIREALSAKVSAHIRFLERLQPYAVSGDVIFAHAALDPTLALEEQTERELLWGRVSSGRPSGLPGKRLVHGHFAAYDPTITATRICVDTGAYYSGRLTAVRLDDDTTILQVSEV